MSVTPKLKILFETARLVGASPKTVEQIALKEWDFLIKDKWPSLAYDICFGLKWPDPLGHDRSISAGTGRLDATGAFRWLRPAKIFRSCRCRGSRVWGVGSKGNGITSFDFFKTFRATPRGTDVDPLLVMARAKWHRWPRNLDTEVWGYRKHVLPTPSYASFEDMWKTFCAELW